MRAEAVWVREKDEKVARFRARVRVAAIPEGGEAKILCSDRYRSPKVVHLLFKRCEELRLRDVEAAWKQARYLPDLVDLIPVEPGVNAFATSEQRISQRITSLALKGEIAGLVSLLDQPDGGRSDMETSARHAFERARALVDSASWDAVAEMWQRTAVHALRQGHLEQAQEASGLSLDFFDGCRPPEALLIRGACLLPAEGYGELVESLVVNDLSDELSESLADAALGLLVRDLGGSLSTLSTETTSALLSGCREIRKRWRGQTRAVSRRFYLSWVEGLLHRRLCVGRSAHRKLSHAVRSLKDDSALVGLWLDLADVQILNDDFEGAREALCEALERVRREGCMEVVVALEEALELDHRALVEARRSVMQHLPPSISRVYPLGP